MLNLLNAKFTSLHLHVTKYTSYKLAVMFNIVKLVNVALKGGTLIAVSELCILDVLCFWGGAVM